METNLNAMSDEEFANHMHNTVETNIEDTEVSESVEEVTDTEQSDDDQTEDTDETNSEDDTKASQTNQEDTDVTEEEGTDTTADKPETSEPNYKEFYEKVTADYKANGKMMPGIKSPDDFISALSMASNYALKTAALKPALKRVKALKDISDDDFNEMIEFRNRNPEVLRKAMIDAKLDPLEMDMDKPVSYKPANYVMSDDAYDFEQAIEPIRDTKEFAVTVDVIQNKWDAKSRELMLDDPKLIIALNEEVQMGRYETIQTMIDQNKALGKTNGRTDLDMYREIASQMDQQRVQQVEVTKTVVSKPVVEDPAVKDQKMKAGISTKKTVSNAVKKYDPATLSDAEFMELVSNGAKFI